MDIKAQRRDVGVSGKTWDKDLPPFEGMYPADNGSSAGKDKTKGHGSAASDNNLAWEVRACSWQRGADTDYMAVEAEKAENDKRFGVPHEDSFPAPSDPAGPKNCGARYQTASYDANDTLPSPSNFSNNPGFMSSSTGDMATSGNPANGGTARIATPGSGRSLPGSSLGGRRETSGGVSARAGTLGGSTIGRSSSLGARNSVLPAAGDVDPGQEGGPQIVSSGYSG
jgi:hypothetical protein